MKHILRCVPVLFVVILCCITGFPQNPNIDSLKAEERVHEEDTNKVHLLLALSNAYAFSIPDTALHYAHEALMLADKLNDDRGTFNAMFYINTSLVTLGNYPLLLDYSLQALTVAKRIDNPEQIAMATGMLA